MSATLTPTHKVTGPARRFYSAPDSKEHLNARVTPAGLFRKANAHDQAPIFCREPDGSTLWVPASNLQPLS